MTSIGEVLESLKIPNLSITSPSFSTSGIGEEEDIVIIDKESKTYKADWNAAMGSGLSSTRGLK